jgi:hypothetical protein
VITTTVPAMKLARLHTALAGVPLTEDQRLALVSASHALEAGWTYLFADLIEAARGVAAEVGTGGPE